MNPASSVNPRANSANLVVQTAFLGDLLLSIPLLKQLRILSPSAKLLLVCRKGFGDFFLKTGLVDQVFEVVKKDSGSYDHARASLASYEIDFLVSPHESWRTVLFIQKIHARKKITYQKIFKSLFFDELIQRDSRLPDALRQLSLMQNQDVTLKSQLAEYVLRERPIITDVHGKLTPPPNWSSMSLRANLLAANLEFNRLRERLGLEQFDFSKVILLFPGSVWATKRWTRQGYEETGKSLLAKGFHVIVMGGPGEEVLANQISDQIPGSKCLAGNTSIYESALLIAFSALVIGNDSASTHLASAADVPVIAVFGPTVLAFGFRPWSGQAYVAEKKELYCRPCGMHGHQQCPLNTHDCMKLVSSNTVLQTALSILTRT